MNSQTPPESDNDDRSDDDEFSTLVSLGAAHHYEDAVLYDYEYRRRRADRRFYAELAGQKNPSCEVPILELACGSGRVTTALLRAGQTVLGIDSSAPMLSRAKVKIDKMGRAHRQRTQLIQADMRAFKFDLKTPLVIAAFNSFEHLYTRDDFTRCMTSIRDVLAPGGVVAFDVQNPDLDWLIRDPTKRWAKTTFVHPVTGRRVVYSTNHFYDPVTQICLVRIYYKPRSGGGEEQIINLSQRKFFPVELETLLWAHSFRIIARYGDFSGEALTGDSESQVVVAQAI